MTFEHSHIVEWVWLVVALIDVWASSSSWVASHRDWVRVQHELLLLSKAQQRVRVSRDAVTRAINTASKLNTIMAAMLCSAALVSLRLPPPPPDYSFARQSLWIILLLIGISGLNASIALHGRFVRYRLAHGYYERQADLRSASQVIVDAYEVKDRRKGDQP